MNLQAIAKRDTIAYSNDHRQAPWNVMGGTLDATHATVSDALAAAGMDYTTEVRDLFSGVRPESGGVVDLDTLIHAPNLRTIVRPMGDGTEKVLAATGKRFTPIQNRDAFAVADLLVAEYESKIVGAADFRGGTASLLVVDLQRPISLELPGGRQDVTNLNLYIRNAHDGSAALTFALSGLRIACTNAVQGALRNAKASWRISHTPNADARIGLAQQAIVAAMNYQDAFQAEAQAMLDTTMVDAEFDKIVSRLWPVPEGMEDTRAGRNRLEVQDQVKALYHGESETLAGIRGTRWGGYNAITEWADWQRPTKGKSEVAKAVSRAEGAVEMTGATARLKARVWDVFSIA